MISIVILTRNRINSLRRCIKSIKQCSAYEREILVVDNGSTDGTIEELHSMKSKNLVNKIFLSDNSLGVCARNIAIKEAVGDIIAQIDDDVIMLKYWDSYVINNIYGKIGAVGVQGAYVEKDWSGFSAPLEEGKFCDVLTGFFWAFKNEGWLYDESFAPFWHEESELQLRMAVEKEYRKKIIPMLCYHNSQRTETVDWELHNRNFNWFRERYKGKYISERDRV